MIAPAIYTGAIIGLHIRVIFLTFTKNLVYFNKSVMKPISPYIIPPLLSLLTAYFLAAMALFRGRRKSENILLAAICVSWTLPCWAFLCHYLMTDEAKLITIERTINTLYVLMPAVSVLFFQVVTDQRNRLVSLLFFIPGIILTFFIHTPYFFYGFNVYSWGRIARAGIAFSAFSLYGATSTLFIIYLFIRKYKKETNRVIKTKLNYLFLSYILSALLSFTSIPSMYGVDFYSLINLIFIPLGILTYGILRYRLMDIGSVIYLSFFWFILSSIIVIPNMALYIVLREYFYRINILQLSVICIVWFLANYFYFNRIQPVINQLLNPVSYNLKKIENEFNRDLSHLMSLDDLASGLTSVIKRALNLENAQMFFRRGYINTFSNLSGQIIDITPRMLAIMRGYDYLEKSLIESASCNDHDEVILLSLFDVTGSEYIIPMDHRGEIISVLFLSQRRDNKRLNDREFRFITRIKAYVSIAVANSVIYQDLSDMKDNLEKIVEERTSIIEKQKTEMESDIELARKIQIALLPNHIPHIGQVDIAYRYEPVMKVGGDFIDIHYREGMSQLGLFICDVSGHGAASAMIASMVKMSLNSWGKFIGSPGRAFVEMRNMLYGKIGDNFITACMCSLDLNTGRVISANAGHPPLMIARRDGSVDVVRSEGKIIIDFMASEYEEKECMLEKGDRLILYTDGVIEAWSKNWDYGEQRFLDLLKENINLPVDELCQRIYEGVALDRESTPVNDDFAILIAEYRGS